MAEKVAPADKEPPAERKITSQNFRQELKAGADNNSLEIHGEQIRNNKVPYQFSGLLVGGASGGKQMVHGAVLISGDFSVDGVSKSIMLVDRWVSGLSVNFFNDRNSAFQHIRDRSTNIDKITDIQETTQYTTSSGSSVWMQLVMEDFPKRFKAKEPSHMSDNETNCVMFAMRFAEKCGHGRAFREAYTACKGQLCF